MAPLLKSCPEPYDETVGSSPPPMTRRLKSIVPVVPRVFERRKDKSPVQIPTTSSPIPSPKQDLVNLSQNIPRRESHSKSAQDLQNALPNCSESISGEITDVVQDTERAAAQEEATYEPLPKEELGTKRDKTQSPPVFYPSQPRTTFPTFPSYAFQASGEPCQPILLPSNTIDHTITFCGEPDSNNSSPISLPSASSTTFTRRTPSSDATSYRSQSLYQGYGHYGSSKLMYESQETFDPQMALMPRGFGYNQPSFRTIPMFEPPPSQDFIHSPVEFAPSRSNDLSAYLLTQFDNPAYADCVLEVSLVAQKTSLLVHSVLIAQSPTLRALLEEEKKISEEGRTVINLVSSDPSLSSVAICSALRYNYGKQFSQESEPITDMKSALSYFAAGRLLQIPQVADIGARSILKYLTLVDAEKALLSVARSTVLPHTEVYNIHSFVDEPNSIPLRGDAQVYAENPFNNILEVIARAFPVSFVLDTSVLSSMELGGFPPKANSKVCLPQSKSQLTSIIFGDFLPESIPIPNVESTIISRILLSVPFAVLVRIFNSMGSITKQHIVQPVIEERERRRSWALQSKSDWVRDQSYSDSLMEALSWEERVVGTGAEMAVVRVRT